MHATLRQCFDFRKFESRSCPLAQATQLASAPLNPRCADLAAHSWQEQHRERLFGRIAIFSVSRLLFWSISTWVVFKISDISALFPTEAH